MLKKRLIPIQLLQDGRLVKTKRFEAPRDVGDPVASSRVYYAQGADELVFLNINRTERTIEPLKRILDSVSAVTFMPLTLGGGIRSREDACELVKHGADKIVVNSIAYSKPSVLEDIAEYLGCQALMVSVDVRRDGNDYACFSDCGRKREAIPWREHLARCVRMGAGEILITSIDWDGTMLGFDLDLIRRVCDLVPVPVIACGGAGNYGHLVDAMQCADLSGVACGSLFHFGDNNPVRAKAYMRQRGIPMRKS